MKLDAKTIRELKRQIESVEIKFPIYLPISVEMTVDGVVVFGNLVYMHPYTFKDMYGIEAYEELLNRPRIPSPYGDDIDS